MEICRKRYNQSKTQSSLGNLTPREYVEKHEMERSS